jgi:folate-dependent phosphoribosylglycinamide formyltransferase PurN
MRIVLLVPNLHAPAELAVNKLLKRKDLDIVGIVISDLSPLRKKYWKYMRYGLRRTGIIYGSLIALTTYLHPIGLAVASLFLWHRKRRWHGLEKLIKENNLLVHRTQNINQKTSREVLESWKPDALVSLYFDQILKKPVIEIPTKAAINMHPGLLPRYKGLWPNFWKLHNGEKFAGVTIHHIDETIDGGDVIEQIRYPIRKRDTNFSLGLKSAERGTKAIARLLLKMKQGVPLPKIKLKGKAKYYSVPRRKHMQNFFNKGRRLFSWAGIRKEFKRHY